MSINSNMTATLLRIQNIIQQGHAGSPQMRTALTRIGTIVASRAKINAQRGGDPVSGKAIYDTGNLINNIRFEAYSTGDADGVKVGVFGVPYAAVHEFGFNGVVSVRDYARLNARTGTKSMVRSHLRKMNILARPYLRPAVVTNNDVILDILGGVFTE